MKKKTALDFACDVCDAKRREPCDGVGWTTEISIDDAHVRVHSSRARAAAESNRPAPDLFKSADVKASRVLRWMLEQGTATQADMKKEFHRLGAVQSNIAHTFDRYWKMSATYVGGARVLMRKKVRGKGQVTWIGSTGDTWEERAANWIALFDDVELERIHGRVETEYIEAALVEDHATCKPDRCACERRRIEREEKALMWFKLVKSEIQRRSLGIAKQIVTEIKRTRRTRTKKKSTAMEIGHHVHKQIEREMRR